MAAWLVLSSKKPKRTTSLLENNFVSIFGSRNRVSGVSFIGHLCIHIGRVPPSQRIHNFYERGNFAKCLVASVCDLCVVLATRDQLPIGAKL